MAAGLATAADPVDSNIVGYVTKGLTAGKMDIVGTHFQNIGDTVVNIQDILPAAGIDIYGRDNLRVWDPVMATYIRAHYYSETYDAADTDYEFDLGPGWGDDDGFRLDFPITPGQGFWLQTRVNASVIIAGEVLKAEDNTVSTLAGKMDLICNTFPVTISIQDILPGTGIDIYGRDNLRVWDPVTATYVRAHYYSETYDAADTDYEFDLGPGWGDDDGFRLDFPITPGQGFWLQTRNNASVLFSAPAGIL